MVQNAAVANEKGEGSCIIMHALFNKIADGHL